MTEQLMTLLKEYGIENGKDLDRAIRSQPVIDIAVFCDRKGKGNGADKNTDYAGACV